FTTRGDYDLAISGLAIVIAAIAPSMRPRLRVVVIAANLAAILSGGRRAGLLAAVFIIVVAIWCPRPFGSPGRGPALAGLTMIFLAGAIPVMLATITNPPSWAVGLNKLVPSNDAVFVTGQNTWEARLIAWRLIVDYVAHLPGAPWLGAGFGMDVVLQSG